MKRLSRVTLLSLCAAAIVAVAGASAAASPAVPAARGPVPASSPADIICRAPRALDGDTLRCANLPASVRLLAIDAPELPGHCRKGRACAPGDPQASRAALADLLGRGRVTLEIVGTDRWGRNLAVARATWLSIPLKVRRSVNLSCAQLAARQAIYVAAWDNGRRIARECGQ